jgi:hypothetical protein
VPVVDVLTAIRLDDDQILRTGEVNDERSDRELPATLVAFQSAAPQSCPEPPLGVSGISAESARGRYPSVKGQSLI